jgi:hypothetical protein
MHYRLKKLGSFHVNLTRIEPESETKTNDLIRFSNSVVHVLHC